ncbi:hypothetical protein OQA88_5072 [Cercophora sp. LCS_1]
MSSSKQPYQNPAEVDDEADMLAEDEIQEVLDEDDGDVPMDSDDEGDNEEYHLQNDSIAYFDAHKDSVFAIAQHPLYPNIIATGGSEGEADDAPGAGYVFDTSAAASRPVLPASYSSNPSAPRPENPSLSPVFSITGHTDSINALTFTLPRGDFLVSGGLDGRLQVYTAAPGPQFTLLTTSNETEEINWLAPCPAPSHPNTFALGASDGSVWVFTIDTTSDTPLTILQSYFLHTASSTAGAWSPDGLLLASVSEDASLHVFDPFGEAAAKNLLTSNNQTVVSLTESDNRFFVDGGLYSVAFAPTGAFLAAGGAGGAIRIVGLPRLSAPAQQARRGGKAEPSSQAGAILASLNVQQDGIETLAFAPVPQTLLAAGSVDGSIAVFDTARSFAVRKHLNGAHDGESVVKVDFVKAATGAAAGWLLTSCGLDGVVRRWDLRGATPSGQQVAAATGLVKEWRGHRGGGEGGGVLGFVQGETGERVVTAGDDALVLVFEA